MGPMLHVLVRQKWLEKPTPTLRARRLLRLRVRLSMALLGPMSVRQMVVPVRVLERGRMPVHLVLNRVPVCLWVTALTRLMHL